MESIGVRRLHFQTCFVGHKFLDLPVSAKANSDDTMIVTAWSDWLWLPDQEYLVAHMPRCLLFGIL